MSKAATPCRCGLPRSQGKIVCLCCWKAAPAKFKASLASLNIGKRRWAARQLLTFARTRKSQIELSQT